MPRRGGSGGVHHTTKQKGRHRDGRGSYASKGKAKNAQRLERTYLEGTWKRFHTELEDK